MHIFVDYYVLEEPFEATMENLKADGSYWGGAEFATMNLVLNLRELGHRVDYRTPTRKTYHLGIIVKDPTLITRRVLRDVHFRKLWLWAVDRMSLEPFVDFLTADHPNPYHGIVVPFQPLERVYGQLPQIKEGALRMVETVNMIQPIPLPKVDRWATPSICFMGAFNFIKQAAFALKVMGEFIQQHEEFEAYAYGSASLWVSKGKDDLPYQQHCERIIAEYGITWHGNLDYASARRVFAHHCASLLPGAHGLTALESLWAGTPVLYSCPINNAITFHQLYVGAGTRGYIGNMDYGVVGFDTRRWLRRLEQLLGDREAWAAHSQWAKDRAQEFLWTKILPPLVEELTQ